MSSIITNLKWHACIPIIPSVSRSYSMQVFISSTAVSNKSPILSLFYRFTKAIHKINLSIAKSIFSIFLPFLGVLPLIELQYQV